MLTFYWALGGALGASTMVAWAEQAVQTRSPDLIRALALTGLLKALLGMLPFAVHWGWFPWVSRHLLVILMGLVGAGMALYYAANLVQHFLMLNSVIPVSRSLGQVAVLWHLVLWDPWWILGGVLFLATACATKRARIWPFAA